MISLLHLCFKATNVYPMIEKFFRHNEGVIERDKCTTIYSKYYIPNTNDTILHQHEKNNVGANCAQINSNTNINKPTEGMFIQKEDRTGCEISSKPQDLTTVKPTKTPCDILIQWRIQGVPPARPPHGSRFFRFDIQIFRNVAGSGVGAPPMRSVPPLREILDPLLLFILIIEQGEWTMVQKVTIWHHLFEYQELKNSWTSSFTWISYWSR